MPSVHYLLHHAPKLRTAPICTVLLFVRLAVLPRCTAVLQCTTMYCLIVPPCTANVLPHRTASLYCCTCTAGFRKYDRILETMCHELAHNVHSGHDAAFRALWWQLRREVEEVWDYCDSFFVVCSFCFVCCEVYGLFGLFVCGGGICAAGCASRCTQTRPSRVCMA